MNFKALMVNTYGPDFHKVDDEIKISFYLGRKSKYKDKFINMLLDEKTAEKLVEDLMRVIWENKIEKLNKEK